MTIYKEFSAGGKKGPFGNLVPIAIMIFFFVSLFFLAKGIFTLLSWIAPALLIGAAILDYTVITDYFKFLGKMLKDNLIMGIVAVLLTVIGFPVVSGFLFFRAYVRKKLKKRNQPRESDFIEYEDMSRDEEDFLILPEVEKPVPAVKKDNKYNNLFE